MQEPFTDHHAQGLDLRYVSISQKIGSVSYQLIDEAGGGM